MFFLGLMPSVTTALMGAEWVNPPVVTTSPGVSSFVEPENINEMIPVFIDPSLVLTNVNNTNLTKAVVQITDGFVSVEDVLGFEYDEDTMGNITGSYDETQGKLSLTSQGATAGIAEWQAALRAVTYHNLSQNPSTQRRRVSFQVSDGALTSPAVTKTVAVAAVNSAPVAYRHRVTLYEDGRASGSLQMATDPENDACTYSISAGPPNGTFSLDEYRVYNYTPFPDFYGVDSVMYTVHDNGNPSRSSSEWVYFEVRPLNDPPEIKLPVSFAANEDVPTPLRGIVFSDIDAGEEDVTAIFSVSSGMLSAEAGGGVASHTHKNGNLSLTGSISLINSFIDKGNLVYTTALNATGNETLSIYINDNGNGPLPILPGVNYWESASTSAEIEVTAVDDRPEIHAPFRQTVLQDGELAFNVDNGNSISIYDVEYSGGNMFINMNVNDNALVRLYDPGEDKVREINSWSYSGSLPDIQAALASMIFLPRPGYTGLSSIILTYTNPDVGGTSIVVSHAIEITVEPIRPAIKSVTAYPHYTGFYKLNHLISIEVLFDHPVIVNMIDEARPYLQMNTFPEGSARADYAVGSGGTRLSFIYQVRHGHYSQALDYESAHALHLNGATIKSIDGTDAVLTLPPPGNTNSISWIHKIMVDGQVPAAPQDLKVSVKEGQIELSWKANTENDLAGYQIYSGTDPRNYSLMHRMNTLDTTYAMPDFTNGINHYISISAIDQAGNEGWVSMAVRTIPKAHQTVSFESPEEQTYGSGPVILSASATSDLPVSYVSANAEVAEVFQDIDHLWKARIMQAGQVEITAFQEGNADFNPAEPVSRTLTIRKAASMITADGEQVHTADGSIKNIMATLNHSESPLSYSPQRGYINAGTYEITVSVPESKNYLAAEKEVTLLIRKAGFTGLSMDNADWVYNGTVRSLAVSGLPAGATVTYTGNGQKDAGVYEVTALVKQADHNDQTLKATLTIHKAEAEITGDALQQHTADGGVKYVLASLNHSEGTLSYSPQQGYIYAGDYTITVSSPETQNYLPASRKIRLYIDKAHFTGVSLPDGDFTYSGQSHFIYAWNVPEGTQVTYTGNGQVNVGTYRVTALLRKEHYHDLEVSGLLRIHRAPAYIHAEAYQVHVYDGTEKQVQATLNHNETQPGYWPQQGYVNAGTYQVTVWARETQNYQETTTDVTLFIDKARFEGISLEDGAYTYDGTVHSLKVNGLPAGATVSYTGNEQVNAGTYRVTALVQQANYYDLELEADLTIHKAPQTITFGELGDTHLENDPDFQLGATASSGLGVKYGYTYEADQAPATVSETGWVVRHTSGQVQITAYQEGNENYHAAEPVSRLLQINSSDATLHAVTLGVETHERPESSIRYVMDCEDNADSVQVFLKTEVGASVQPGRVFSIAVPGPGIHRQVVTIVSQDGTQTREYEIWVEKRFRKEEIVVEKFNSILLVNNNTETNGGYRFTDYEWQLNGIPVGTGQYFSQGSGSLDAGVYRVRMKTESGDWLSTCDFGFESAAPLNLTLYPNPVVSGRRVKIKSEVAGGRIRIVGLNGQQVLSGELKGREGEFDLPGEIAPGVYILQYTVEGQTRNLRFVVEK